MIDGIPIAVGGGDTTQTEMTTHFVEEDAYDPVSNADALVSVHI